MYVCMYYFTLDHVSIQYRLATSTHPVIEIYAYVFLNKGSIDDHSTVPESRMIQEPLHLHTQQSQAQFLGFSPGKQKN